MAAKKSRKGAESDGRDAAIDIGGRDRTMVRVGPAFWIALDEFRAARGAEAEARGEPWTWRSVREDCTYALIMGRIVLAARTKQRKGGGV